MNKIKVNFKSEKLIVDWISLNIADFLANLGCKSTLVDESERKSYVLTKIHKHRYSTEFVVNLNSCVY